MVVFEKGTYVFLPDEDHCYVPAKVTTTFEQGKAGAVSLVEGDRMVKVSAKHSAQCQPMDQQSLRRWPDMVVLKQLDNASLLHNIKLRYMKDEIYTNIGTILISVNPYKQIPDLFSPDMIDRFINCSNVKEMGPHIFGVAEASYSQMVNMDEDQSCIITGESGAGKTEATKLYLQYIAERSRRNMRSRAMSEEQVSQQGDLDVPLREKILGANPLMEAFGNAKTVRNDNSSRFGKLIDVHFLKSLGCVAGGRITNYLLEKSRVVGHLEGERSYHVFYQLCRAANQLDPSLKSKYKLMEPDQYYYLNQSKKPSTIISNVDDAREWEATVNAMKLLNIEEEQRDGVYRVLSGILHLGNIDFEPISSTCDFARVTTDESLATAAEMFGVDKKALEGGLLTRDISNKTEVVIQKHNVREARDSRDALAKHMYSRLFNFLTGCINNALASRAEGADENDIRTISVLDIFGFESFTHNSFEQLCINYCNEKLQGFFNNHIFRLEQEEYMREEIDVSQIGFSDNAAVIAAIDHRSNGVFAICDDEVNLLRGTDDGFLNKIHAAAKRLQGSAPPKKKSTTRLSIRGSIKGAMGGNSTPFLADKVILKQPDVKELRKNRSARKAFIVTHFAGEVMYNVEGFLEKNRDVLRNDLRIVVNTSQVDLVVELFSEDGSGASSAVKSGAKKKGNNNKKTLGRKFQEQLESLMIRLGATEPHFVRTIKPNVQKKALCFEAPLVLDQLRYAGLLEVCRIRQMGYPIRKDHEEFFRLFCCIHPEAKSLDELLNLLVKDGLLEGMEWQKGKTKIFMRASQFDAVSRARESALWEVAVLVQTFIRQKLARSRYLRTKSVFKDLEVGVNERDRDILEKSIPFAQKLPNAGKHVALLERARRVLAELKEEQEHLDEIAIAVESRDMEALPSLIARAESMGLGKKPIVEKAKVIMQQARAENEAMEALRDAISERDLSALAQALETADELKLGGTVEAKTARALLSRLEEEAKLLAELEDAMNRKATDEIGHLIQALLDIGAGENELVTKAQKMLKKIIKESKDRKKNLEKLDNDLREAMENKDLEHLNQLRIRIEELGAKGELVDAAMELRAKLEARDGLLRKIAVEMNVLAKRSRTLDGLEEDDIEPLSTAIESAESQGFTKEEEPEVAAAIKFLDRMSKQLEVQEQLEEALDTNTYSALLAALMAAQALGMQTMNARRVAEEVRHLEKIKMALDRIDNRRMRENLAAMLRFATKEEQDDVGRERLEKMNSEKFLQQVEETKDDDRYELKNHYRIRSDDDYTEQFPPAFRNHEANMKLWSSRAPIPKSLHEVDDDQNVIAIRINGAILRFCGDLSATNVANLAQFIVIQGLIDPRVADEIYIQLCKHLNGNSSADSEDSAWLIMCMCTKYFPPSELLTPYLLYFLNQHADRPSLIGNYVRLCLAQLGSTLELGPSKFKPSVEELAAYRKRPPVYITIKIVDGRSVSLPVSPNERIETVHRLVRQSTGILDAVHKPTWAVFVQDTNENKKDDLKARLVRFYKVYNTEKLSGIDAYVAHWRGREEELFTRLRDIYGPEPEDTKPGPLGKDGDAHQNKGGMRIPITTALAATKFLRLNQKAPKSGPAPKCSWPLPWWAFVGDIALRMARQSREPHFIFKRKVFSEKGVPDVLHYHQLVNDVQAGVLAIRSEHDIAELAAIALLLKHDNNIDLQDEEALINAALGAYIPKSWLKEKPIKYWAKKIASQHSDIGTSGSAKLRQRYVDTCKRAPTYGMCFFHATRQDSEREYVIGVDQRGLHILNAQKDEVVRSFPLKAIKKYGATSGCFWMKVKKSALKNEGGRGIGNRLSRSFGGAKPENMNMESSSSGNKFSFLKRNDGFDVVLNCLQSWELYDMVFSLKVTVTDDTKPTGKKNPARAR